HHAAAVRLVVAAEDVDHGRLARPVGPDQPQDLAVVDVCRHTVQGVYAAEEPDEVLEAELEHLPPPRPFAPRAHPTGREGVSTWGPWPRGPPPTACRPDG